MQPTPAQLRDAIPLAALLGVELLDARPELVRATLDWSPERCTAGGLMHGGALMALADTCGGACAFLNLPDGALGTATIESKTNFLRAVRDGTVTASTRPLHAGRTTIVLETEIVRGDDAHRALALDGQDVGSPGDDPTGARRATRPPRRAALAQPARAAQRDDCRAV